MTDEAMENKALRQCSGCHSIITLEHFNMNRKGEYYMTCNRCCSRRKEYKEANTEQIKRYNENNKEAIATQHKEYRGRNKETIAQRAKTYRQEHKEHIAERNKEYREKNKEKIAERGREYREENKDKLREKRHEYYENNPDKYIECKNRELARRKIICECGALCSKYNVADHCKFNKRHLEWLASRDNADANPTG